MDATITVTQAQLVYRALVYERQWNHDRCVNRTKDHINRAVTLARRDWLAGLAGLGTVLHERNRQYQFMLEASVAYRRRNNNGDENTSPRSRSVSIDATTTVTQAQYVS